MKDKIVSISKEVMGGTPVFFNTRVPIKTLLEYIENGETIDSFLADYPTVSKDQVSKIIENFKDKISDLVA